MIFAQNVHFQGLMKHMKPYEMQLSAILASPKNTYVTFRREGCFNFSKYGYQ